MQLRRSIYCMVEESAITLSILCAPCMKEFLVNLNIANFVGRGQFRNLLLDNNQLARTIVFEINTNKRYTLIFARHV